MKKLLLLILSVHIGLIAYSSSTKIDTVDAFKERLDEAFIIEVQDSKSKDKVLHAEPLFIDLIRDLGARKGEKEWNIGMRITDRNRFDLYTSLIEYEFAPLDRLGFEFELPFSFYYPRNGNGNFIEDSLRPGNKLNSVKLASQWSFFVSEKMKTSMALGYIHEFELNDFNKYSEGIYQGNVFNPFMVIAKRWGNNHHTLLYHGPSIIKHNNSNKISSNYQVNTNFHYMIPGTRNFIGLEFNKNFRSNDFDMTIRPQMRVGIADNLMVGIVSGIPIKRENDRFSSFIRLIYEPGHKHPKNM